MDEPREIKTVLGKREIGESVITLSHEHICCCSEFLNTMSERYLDKTQLTEKAVDALKEMKNKYRLGLFIDCTPLNIGRDVDLLKTVSARSGVDIVCSTGFYYNDDPILNCASAETLARYMEEDAARVCAGVIKAAVEYDVVSGYNVKLLRASAIAQKRTGLPIVLHTNASNKNGWRAVEILLREDVDPRKIVVGHLSDTDENAYIESFLRLGCYVALDRLYDDETETYIRSKVHQILALCEDGYADKLLLSHDDAIFQGFGEYPQIKAPRWHFMFDHILPALGRGLSEKLSGKNAISWLCGR